jgi:hypothetical protein
VIVEPRLQMILGFDLMRAAIEGGHDLPTAWQEAMDISTRSAHPLPHVWGGALGFLLLCANELDEAGVLAGIEVPGTYGEFLHAGHDARIARVYAATQAIDTEALATMASVLVHAVAPWSERLSFRGRFARLLDR